MGHKLIQLSAWTEVTMRFRLLAAFAAVSVVALLAGCAEGPYYGGPSYSSGYGYDYDYYGPGYYPGYYYGPSYSYYGPGYFDFYYRSGSGGHWDSGSSTSRSFQGSVQTQPQSSSRVVTQPRVRSSNTNVAHAGRHVERQASVERRARAERQRSNVASQTRTGPDREHGG
jgi:hypothetical protein